MFLTVLLVAGCDTLTNILKGTLDDVTDGIKTPDIKVVDIKVNPIIDNQTKNFLDKRMGRLYDGIEKSVVLARNKIVES